MILVGGVSQLYQGDLDLGRRAAERLAAEDLGHGVVVEELYYGAVAVAQRLQELRPDALLLVGAEARGRPAGTVERRHLVPSAGDAHGAVSDAVQGYVSIDLVVDVAAGLGTLPGRVVGIEVEPATTESSIDLSPKGDRALEEALSMVREEVRRTPALLLADEIRTELARHHLAPSPALAAMQGLLADLQRLDATGQWGGTFVGRDRVRGCIAGGKTSEGMSHLDWGLWWTLVEELDRLQREDILLH